MEIQGHIENGMIVLHDVVSLPEGAAVTVTVRAAPVVRFCAKPTRVQFPLVPSSAPGSNPLLNERIHEILEEEDIDLMTRE